MTSPHDYYVTDIGINGGALTLITTLLCYTFIRDHFMTKTRAHFK